VISERSRYKIHCPGLPLSVYREVAAHLRQVEGVEAELIPQTAQTFDYNQSQVGGLWIQYDATRAATRERVKQILVHYQDRYGAWDGETDRVMP
jgi:hypothetical protein